MVVFWTLCLFFDNTDVLIYIRSFEVWIAAAAIFATWPVAQRMWKNPELGQSVSMYEVYAFGTVLILLGTFFSSTWLLFWRLADEPRWMVDSWLNGIWLIIITLGIMLQLISPGIDQGAIPKKTVRNCGAAMLFAIFVAFSGIAFSNSFVKFSLFLRPYLAEDPSLKPAFWRDHKTKERIIRDLSSE
jgi:hypothetical protein